jgi:hypothetical protein
VAKSYLEKHNVVRAKVSGTGATSAILTDVEGLRRVCTKALCFQGFVHYFEEVPSKQCTNTNNSSLEEIQIVRDS